MEIQLKPSVRFHFIRDRVRIEMETQDIYLRSYEACDFQDCLRLYGDRKLTKYFDSGEPMSEDRVEILIHERATKFYSSRSPFGLFSAFLKSEMAFVGQFDFLPYENATAEVGCILSRKFHNQGLCLDVIRLLILDYPIEVNKRIHRFKCDGLPINRVIATTHPKNYPSKKILETVGMTFDTERKRFNSPRLWYSYILPSLSNRTLK